MNKIELTEAQRKQITYNDLMLSQYKPLTSKQKLAIELNDIERLRQIKPREYIEENRIFSNKDRKRVQPEEIDEAWEVEFGSESRRF